MAVKDFEGYVTRCRKEFRKTLGVDDLWIGNMKSFIQIVFSECSNQFEEDTLVENLKEEFEDYLKEIKEQA